MNEEEELVRTPVDRVLQFYVNNQTHRRLPDTPFLFDGKVVATNGRAICIGSPMLCNQVYQTCDTLPSHFADVFGARPDKGDEQTIPIESLKTLIAQSPEDFRPGKRGCVFCGDSGTCTDCDCGTSHECGKCEGVGFTWLPPKKVVGIGTGSFSSAELGGIASACAQFELTEFQYLGSGGGQDYLQFFKIGDCDLILASEAVKEGQERVCLERSAP
jgi:hypothetical protein